MRVVALILLAGLALCGCSLTGEGASAQKPTRPNVLLIVFDEFGGDTLLGPDGKIDAGRYPNFAALARDAKPRLSLLGKSEPGQALGGT